jgi:hypothetical protein
MFLTCMNYWFYYMSTWIIMIGLWWQYRGRPGIRDIAIISAPPVAAATVTIVTVMSLMGGMKSGGLRLLDILVARMFDARVPGGSWYPDQRFMTASDWFKYPSLVEYRLEWAYNFDFRWFALAAGCTFLLLWFRKRSSVVSALILLAGGFSWYYVMFQHTHIHHFVGQYSFMAVCPILGLIVGEAIIWALRALRLLRERFTPYHQGGSANFHLAINVGAAILMVAVSFQMHTLVLSSTVEAKYRQAVSDICRQQSEVTLANLQLASKDWGIEWRAKQLADTNQLPKCSSSAS